MKYKRQSPVWKTRAFSDKHTKTINQQEGQTLLHTHIHLIFLKQTSMQAHTHAQTNMQVYMHTQTHTQIHTQTHANIKADTNVHAHSNTHTNTHTHARTHTP